MIDFSVYFNFIKEVFQFLGFVEYLVFIINILIFIFGNKIVTFLNHNKNKEKHRRKLRKLRLTNIILFLLYSLTTVLETNIFQNMLMTGISVMGLYLFWNFMLYYIEKRYTKEKEINGKLEKVETYESDIFKWIASIIMIFVSVNFIANIWEWNSLWQTGSVLASILAFLAITHSSWLPDNISGLIILHKSNFEASDVIKFTMNGEDIIGFVGKITLTDITIYDLVDKHPIFIRNSNFRDVNIHLLSKADSSSKEGIQRYIDLKIGYSSSSASIEQYAKELFEKACEISSSINKNKKIRVEVLNNGDFAVEWRFFYFANARNMKSAEFAMNRAAKDVAEIHESISLDTPSLLNVKKV